MSVDHSGYPVHGTVAEDCAITVNTDNKLYYVTARDKDGKLMVLCTREKSTEINLCNALGVVETTLLFGNSIEHAKAFTDQKYLSQLMEDLFPSVEYIVLESIAI